jgi:hypothetical protein
MVTLPPKEGAMPWKECSAMAELCREFGVAEIGSKISSKKILLTTV